jgi:hypothetical protein
VAAAEAERRSWRVGWLVVAACLVLGSAWLLSYPAGLPGDLFGFVWLGLLGLAWGSLAIAWAAMLVAFVVRVLRRRPLRSAPLAVATLVLGIGAALAYGGALRLRFELSERSLRNLVDRYTADARGETPVEGRAGLYGVRRVARGSGDSVLVLTHACTLGECGFSYSPNGRPPDICEDSYSEQYEHVAGAWYTVYIPIGGGCVPTWGDSDAPEGSD